MANQYWVRHQDKMTGPFSGQQLKQMATAGMILTADMISSDQINWQMAGQVKGLFQMEQPTEGRGVRAPGSSVFTGDDWTGGISSQTPRPKASPSPQPKSESTAGIPAPTTRRPSSPPVPVSIPRRSIAMRWLCGVWFLGGAGIVITAVVLASPLIPEEWYTSEEVLERRRESRRRDEILEAGADPSNRLSNVMREGGYKVPVNMHAVLDTEPGSLGPLTWKSIKNNDPNNPNHTPPNKQVGGATASSNENGTAQLLLIRGRKHCQKGDYDAAVREFTKAIELKPKLDVLANAYISRGIAHHMKGDIESAAKDFTKALADLETHQRLGGTVDPGLMNELREASKRRD